MYVKPLSLLFFISQIAHSVFSSSLSADSFDPDSDQKNINEILLLDTDDDDGESQSSRTLQSMPQKNKDIEPSVIYTRTSPPSTNSADENEENDQRNFINDEREESGSNSSSASDEDDLTSRWYDTETNEEICPKPYWGALALRHIEGKGIGYGDGYTTLDGFFLFPFPNLTRDYAFFVDARGHIFDDGKLAANIGLGTRILRSHIHTIGAYYDYRQTKHYHYNQISFNYENLGPQFDWRANGYFPIGAHTSPEYGHAKFDSFEGHSMIISRKKEFAMWGINAEIGKEFRKKFPFKCYGAIGPYYYGRSNTNAWGGQIRFNTEINEYIRLEFNGSYDNIFHGIGQGQLSLVLPLGSTKKKGSSKKRCSQYSLQQRISQRVERNEIIVVDHKKHKSTAIDPTTGQPYFFWFVNNLSHSQGTYESPFNTLLDAQVSSNIGDVIYIFPGDGTDTGMQNGIILQDDQRLLGSSIEYPFNTTEGRVTVPALTTRLPLLSSNTALIPVVTLGNNNEVAGLSLNNLPSSNYFTILGGPLSTGKEISDTFVHNCVINSNNAQAINITTNLNLGNVFISDCEITSTLIDGIIISDNASLSNGIISISNCNITGGADGIHIVRNLPLNILNISNCTSSGVSDGIRISRTPRIQSLNISNSVLSGQSAPGLEIFFDCRFASATVSNFRGFLDFPRWLQGSAGRHGRDDPRLMTAIS